MWPDVAFLCVIWSWRFCIYLLPIFSPNLSNSLPAHKGNSCPDSSSLPLPGFRLLDCQLIIFMLNLNVLIHLIRTFGNNKLIWPNLKIPLHSHTVSKIVGSSSIKRPTYYGFKFYEHTMNIARFYKLATLKIAKIYWAFIMCQTLC